MPKTRAGDTESIQVREEKSFNLTYVLSLGEGKTE